MKDCKNFIPFIGECNKRPEDECVLLDNDGVPGGKIQLDLIVGAYRNFTSDSLRTMANSKKPGCVAESLSKQAVSIVLTERGESL